MLFELEKLLLLFNQLTAHFNEASVLQIGCVQYVCKLCTIHKASADFQYATDLIRGGIHSQEMIKMKWLRSRNPGFIVTIFLYS